MESQLQKTHDAHGHHYDEQDDALTHATGHDHNEDEHPEKKSMMQKVKEKAKKLKNKITGHGNDHEHEVEDDEDDDDDETVEDPDVHGAPMHDSAKVGQLGGPDAILSQQRHNLEKPSVKAEDRNAVTKPLSSHGPTPPASTGAYGANLSEPSGIGHSPTPPVSTGADGANLSEPSGIGHGLGLGHHRTLGHDVHPDKWTSKVGQPTGVEEDPFAPNPARLNNPIQGHDAHKGELESDLGKSTGHQGHDAHKGELKSDLGKSTAIPDSRVPKDPSRLGSHPLNYESKVTDPTHTGGKEVDMSKKDPSRLGSHPLNYESRVTDPTHTGCKEVDMSKKDPTRLGSHPLNYESKVTDPTHTGGEEADLSKMQHSFENMGVGSNPKHYDPNHPENLPHDTLTGNQSSKSSSYTEKTSSGTGSGTETVPPQVHHGGSGAVAMDEGKETDKGVSAKEYMVETLKPGDEDKALSGVISHALHRGHEEDSEKKSGQDRPMGIATESAEDQRRLGTDRHEEHQQQQNSGDASVDKNMSERLRDAVGSWFGGQGDAPQGTPAAGSWFGGKVDAPQGTLGTSNVTDQGLSSNPRGDQKS